MLSHHRLKVYEKVLALGAGAEGLSAWSKSVKGENFEPNRCHAKQILKIKAVPVR